MSNSSKHDKAQRREVFHDGWQAAEEDLCNGERSDGGWQRGVLVWSGRDWPRTQPTVLQQTHLDCGWVTIWPDPASVGRGWSISKYACTDSCTDVHTRLQILLRTFWIHICRFLYAFVFSVHFCVFVSRHWSDYAHATLAPRRRCWDGSWVRFVFTVTTEQLTLKFTTSSRLETITVTVTTGFMWPEKDSVPNKDSHCSSFLQMGWQFITIVTIILLSGFICLEDRFSWFCQNWLKMFSFWWDDVNLPVSSCPGPSDHVTPAPDESRGEFHIWNLLLLHGCWTQLWRQRLVLTECFLVAMFRL